jgi:UDPglucose 6-dehydrogenase
MATPLLDGTWQSNEVHNGIITKKLRLLFKNLAGKRITVLGLTYKPDTSTLRRSISLAVIRELINEKAIVAAHDPRADRTEIFKALETNAADGKFRFEDDAYKAAHGAEVLILITGWNEYKSLDYAEIKSSMSGNLLIDANNLLNRTDIENLGFQYIGIGQGCKTASKNKKDKPL